MVCNNNHHSSLNKRNETEPLIINRIKMADYCCWSVSVVIMDVLVLVTAMCTVMSKFVYVCGWGWIQYDVFLPVNEVTYPGDGQTIKGTILGK